MQLKERLLDVLADIHILRIPPQERFEAFVNNLTPSSNSKLVLNFRLNLLIFQDSKRGNQDSRQKLEILS